MADIISQYNSLPNNLKKEVQDFIEFLLSKNKTTNMVEEPSEVYKLTTKEREAVKVSKKQIAKGQYYSNEQVFEEIEKWLTKK